MRLWLALSGLMALVACQGPSAIQSSAKGPLLTEVEHEIMDLQELHHGDCPAAKIMSARIVQAGVDVTQEEWTLMGCGRTFTYDVTVNHEGGGGQVSIHEHETVENP